MSDSTEPPDHSLVPVRRSRRHRTLAAALLGGAVLVAACTAGVVAVADDGDEPTAHEASPRHARERTTTTVERTTTSSRPKRTTTTTEPPPPPPPVVEMPALPAGGLAQGASGDVVLAYEYRLRSLRFDPGPVDGVFDEATRYSVEAFQKLGGIARTGVIDEAVRFGLSVFQWPAEMVDDGEPNRVEVDLDRQVMMQYRDGDLVLITTVSTGSGEIFCGGNDGCQYATTPVGRYEFQWRYRGWRDGDLGRLYNPFYFNGGIAVHGYQSVPTEPASHGCVRIPMHVADYFPDTVAVGEPVYVLGTQIAPFGKATPTTAAPPPATAPPPPPPPPPPAETTSPPTTVAPTTPPTPAPTTPPTPAPSTTKPPPPPPPSSRPSTSTSSSSSSSSAPPTSAPTTT